MHTEPDFCSECRNFCINLIRPSCLTENSIQCWFSSLALSTFFVFLFLRSSSNPTPTPPLPLASCCGVGGEFFSSFFLSEKACEPESEGSQHVRGNAGFIRGELVCKNAVGHKSVCVFAYLCYFC